MEEISTTNNINSKRANNPIYQASHFIIKEGIRMGEKMRKENSPFEEETR